MDLNPLSVEPNLGVRDLGIAANVLSLTFVDRGPNTRVLDSAYVEPGPSIKELGMGTKFPTPTSLEPSLALLNPAPGSLPRTQEWALVSSCPSVQSLVQVPMSNHIF